MKIALVSHEYPPEKAWGDLGTFVFHQARALASLGHDVHVFNCSPRSPQGVVCEDGLTVTCYHGSGAFKRMVAAATPERAPEFGKNLAQGMDLLVALHRELKQGDFDVVEVPHLGGESFFTTNCLDVPTVIRFHASTGVIGKPRGTSARDGFLADSLEHLGIKAGDALTASSRWLADHVRSRLALERPLAVIPNVIHLPHFDQDSGIDIFADLKVPPGRVTVLFLNRLADGGATKVLQAAMVDLLARHKDALFVLAGPDPKNKFENEIQPALAAKDLAQSCVYLGEIGERETRALIGQTDIFFLPSTEESCPYICLGAMAAGRAVLAFESGGLPELVRNGLDGFLVPPGDFPALIEKFDWLITNAETRASLGKSARERIVSRYSGEEVASRTLDFYSFSLRVPPPQTPANSSTQKQDLGPHNWWSAWWLTGTERVTPALSCDQEDRPILASLSLDEFRFVECIFARVYLENHGDGDTSEKAFLADLQTLYLEMAEEALEETVNGNGANRGKLDFPPLDHPLFQEGLAATFVDETWRLVQNESFKAWLVKTVAQPTFREAARSRISLRRLAVMAAQIVPTAEETYGALREIYRVPETQHLVIEQDREFFTLAEKGPDFQRAVRELGLHLPLDRPPVFPPQKGKKKEPEVRVGERPIVTVLIPSYRHAEYIVETIKSVLGQSFANFSVIVIDDGSPDETVAQAQSLSDNRLQVRENDKNLGLGESICTALETIETPYVALLNSDDLFHPERLEHCLAALQANPEAALVVTEVALMDDAGQCLKRENASLVDLGPQIRNLVKWYEGTIKGNLPANKQIEIASLLSHNHFLTSSNLVCRTEYLRAKMDIFRGLKYCLDWSLFLEAAREEKLLFLPKALIAYRLHQANTMWFQDSGRGDFILEVNQVLALFFRTLATQMLTRESAPVVAKRLAALLCDHAALHNDADGYLLYLAGLGGIRNADLTTMAMARVAQKARHQMLDQLELPSLDIRTFFWDALRNGVSKHVAEGYQEHARDLEEKLKWALLELQAEIQRREDEEEQKWKLKSDRDWEKETRESQLVDLRKVEQEKDDQIAENERLQQSNNQTLEELTAATAENKKLGAENEGLEKDIEGLTGDLAEERKSSAAALVAEQERTAAAHTLREQENQHHLAMREKARMAMRVTRFAHSSEMERLAKSHEMRVGKFLLGSLRLRGIYKTLLRVAKVSLTLNSRGWTRLGQALSSSGKRIVIASEEEFPVADGGFLIGELQAYRESGFDPVVFSWGPGRKDLQGGPDRRCLWARRIIHRDSFLQSRDRQYFEKRSPELVDKVLALIGEDPMIGQLFSFARATQISGAKYVHGYGAGYPMLAAFVAGSLLELPWGISLAGPDLGGAWLHPKTVSRIIATAAVVTVDSQRSATDLRAITSCELPGLSIRLPGLAAGKSVMGSAPTAEKCLFVSIGMVHPRRDLLVLAEAVAKSREQGANLGLEWLGRPRPTGAGLEAWDQLQATVADLDLRGHFWNRGDLDPARVGDLLARAQVLVATGNDLDGPAHVGIPHAVITAMAAGIPVIASRAGALEEVIRDGQEGLLVAAGDVEALTKALVKLAGDPELRATLGVGARRRYEELMGAETEKQFHDQLKRLLG